MLPVLWFLRGATYKKEITNMSTKNLTLTLLVASSLTLGGCTAVALVDAAASTAIGAGKLAVKGTTAAIGAVIPDGDDEKEKKE